MTIQAPSGLQFVYAHLSKALVRPGQYVGLDTIVGRVGQTGNAKESGEEPHVHVNVTTSHTILCKGGYFRSRRTGINYCRPSSFFESGANYFRIATGRHKSGAERKKKRDYYLKQFRIIERKTR